MSKEEECRILRSVASAWCGHRNVGNIRLDEIDVVTHLIKKKFIKTSIYKDSEWCELTNVGQERLYYLNGLRLGV